MNTNNEETQTFEQKVTSIVSSASLDEAGNLVLPEGLELDEATKFAVTSEKRRRDTQSAYSKAQQRLKTLETENDHTWQLLESKVSAELTIEEKTELEELKTVDLDKWRLKLNALDGKKKDQIKVTKTEIQDKSLREVELAARKDQIKLYNEQNPDHQITDDVIDNEIPPKFTKKLAAGDISFEEFIIECNKYLTKGKVLDKGTKTDEDEVDLSKANGSGKIPDAALAKASAANYRKETY